MSYFLGISAFYHDSAACLVGNGEVIAAAQEERFTRVKHDRSFPINAINFCLKYANIDINDVDVVAFYEDGDVKFDRLYATVPIGLLDIKTIINKGLGKYNYKKIIRKKLNYKGAITNYHHHMSHMASAFLPSPFDSASVLTIDGVGAWDTAATSTAGKGKIHNYIGLMRFPQSLGLAYSAFTYFLGFKVNSGEYKVMGLAPYGEPVYKELIGQLDNSHFNFYKPGMVTKKFYELLGERRQPESELKQRHFNMAASIQSFTEDRILELVERVEGLKDGNLCMAGGVALNCLANSRILKESKFKNLWIQPAAGDAGGSLGCAMIAAGLKKYVRTYYLGPKYSDIYIKNFLRTNNIKAEVIVSPRREKIIAQYLVNGKIVGLFQGRMEFGPRALGNRSILADPRPKDMQDKMNKAIKKRESFRPFAPSVLEERAKDYFDLEVESPYMLLVANTKVSTLPAVTHVNKTSRLHTVRRSDNPRYYDIIQEFDKLTNCPVVLNTSFNVRGEPIVCSPEDAFKCFKNTDIDVLVLEDYVICKGDL